MDMTLQILVGLATFMLSTLGLMSMFAPQKDAGEFLASACWQCRNEYHTLSDGWIILSQRIYASARLDER
ncbi:hypothetical protein QW180_22230 [Vibrio sinaloensis]|nr:hypothetical protein [Vibrio sinaloensis]